MIAVTKGTVVSHPKFGQGIAQDNGFTGTNGQTQTWILTDDGKLHKVHISSLRIA